MEIIVQHNITGNIKQRLRGHLIPVLQNFTCHTSNTYLVSVCSALCLAGGRQLGEKATGPRGMNNRVIQETPRLTTQG